VAVGGRNSFNPRRVDSNIVQNGLDFILTHFEAPIWPRTISTYTTQGRQILVYNREEAFARFKQSNFLDCRINAYPDYTGFGQLNRQPPNFIFIDLDSSSFRTERAHVMARNATLKNIKKVLSGTCTELWSGNGFHIYQPIDAFPLEQEEMFSKFDQPSRFFLKFAETHLSGNKSDPSHNPSFMSCMIRIPGSHNSKVVEKNNGTTGPGTEVKIIQCWDGFRPKINLLLYDFYMWLGCKEFNRIQRQVQVIQKQSRRAKWQRTPQCSNNGNVTATIRWIERLLQTPLEDYRKTAISLILAPYLVNVKRMEYHDVSITLTDWLTKCDSLRKLQFNPAQHIKRAIGIAAKKGIPAMGLITLQEKNKDLYYMLRLD
jgi:hypothetical protein